MGSKRIIFLIVLLFLTACAIGFFLIENEIEKNPDSNKTLVGVKHNKPKTAITAPIAAKFAEDVKKADLYSDSLYSMPLISIFEIANSSNSTKQMVNKVLELSQGFYYLKRNSEHGKMFVILQMPISETENRYLRHNIQTADIYTDGHVEYMMLGYNGQEDEINNAVVSKKGETWLFDESVEVLRPLSHIVYDNKKKILFSETWNYNEEKPIKYEMKNASGSVVSVMKETIDGVMGYRKEHIFYDNSGNIIKSLTIHYEGSDLKWFTYYDASSAENSVTIESEYENGMKNIEKIYNSEYKLIYTIKAEYKDGLRTKIEVYDSEGKKVETLVNQ